MIGKIGRLLGLYAAMGILGTVPLTVVATAHDGDDEPAAAQGSITSQEQTGVTGQAATTMGVPVLGGSDKSGDQTDGNDS